MIDQHKATKDAHEQPATVQVHQNPVLPRVLSAQEVKAVAGGPTIQNQSQT